MSSQEIPYQMKRLRRVLETQQHVGEHRQRPLAHNGVPHSTKHLRVKINNNNTFVEIETKTEHLIKFSLHFKNLHFYILFF